MIPAVVDAFLEIVLQKHDLSKAVNGETNGVLTGSLKIVRSIRTCRAIRTEYQNQPDKLT